MYSLATCIFSSVTWIFLCFVLISLHWLSHVDSWRAFCPLGIYTILWDTTDSASICDKSRHTPHSPSQQRGQWWASWSGSQSQPALSMSVSQKSHGLFGSVLEGLSSLSSLSCWVTVTLDSTGARLQRNEWGQALWGWVLSKVVWVVLLDGDCAGLEFLHKDG